MRGWISLVVGAAVYSTAVAWSATRLPADGVPLRYGASGLADDLGSRSEAVTASVVLGVVVLALGVGVVGFLHWGSPSLADFPHKEYWTTPERLPRLRRMLVDDVGSLMGALLVVLSLVPIADVLALQSVPPRLPPLLFWPVVGLLLVGTPAWCWWMVQRRYVPPR